jgi:hypothetical protein
VKIELQCTCGARAVYDDGDMGVYINHDGALDPQGRKYIVELMADRWKAEHVKHVRVEEAHCD